MRGNRIRKEERNRKGRPKPQPSPTLSLSPARGHSSPALKPLGPASTRTHSAQPHPARGPASARANATPHTAQVSSSTPPPPPARAAASHPASPRTGPPASVRPLPLAAPSGPRVRAVLQPDARRALASLSLPSRSHRSAPPLTFLSSSLRLLAPSSLPRCLVDHLASAGPPSNFACAISF